MNFFHDFLSESSKKMDSIELEKSSGEYNANLNKVEETKYQIAICQDGKFAVTFDTGKLRYEKTIYAI